MNFNVVPSLAVTSALSVTVSLYYHGDLQTYGVRAVNIEGAITNAYSLPLPDILKDEILSLVLPIGKQISKWMYEFHRLLYYRIQTDYINLYQKLSWTNLATIDYKRTAENCISSGLLSDIQAFLLACGSGNVDHIYRLWPLVKPWIHQEILFPSGFAYDYNSQDLPQAYKVWMAFLDNKLEDYRRVNVGLYRDEDDVRFMLKKAVDNNIVGTAEFFIQKLNPQVKRQIVYELVVDKFDVYRHLFDVPMFIFLMSHLDDDCIQEIFFSLPLVVLDYYLMKWPLQQFFMHLTDFLWPVFPFSDLHVLTETISDKIIRSPMPRMYEDIFKALWLKIPCDEQAIFFVERVSPYLDDLFRPYRTDYAISRLFKGREDAYDNFRNTLLPDESAVMNILVSENLHEAVKDIFRQQFAKEDFVYDFYKLYAIYTRVYKDEYDGTEYVWS